MLGLLLLTLTLGISPLVLVQAEFPTDPCWLEDEACVIGPENLLSSLSEVPDVVTCRQLCKDNKGCNFFSYFGPESFPFRELCLLLSSCDSLHSCEDCVTEEISCFTPCGAPLEGWIDENLVDIITGVPTELDCKSNCRANPSCNVYTYHDSEDVNFPSLCSLLSEVMAPLQSCQHCSTGFPDCKNISEGICFFSIDANNTFQTSYKFTETGWTTVNILPALGNEECELTVVAIGGGGGTSSLGGGGSGYVTSTSMTVSPSQLVVTVGGPGELSSLETSEGQTIITAQPGKNGLYVDGGAGYSGGGAGSSCSPCYNGDGGEDGGDGDDAPGCSNCDGGAGSRLQISSLPISSFTLTPGRGGRGSNDKVNYEDSFGGGGGGVLVDGSGPQETAYDGQGYGGGGGRRGHPGPGLVLLEIKPKQ